MPADEMAELLGIKLPVERPYETAAGYVLAVLGEIPSEGAIIVSEGWRFEVVDMDGRRIDKLLVART